MTPEMEELLKPKQTLKQSGAELPAKTYAKELNLEPGDVIQLKKGGQKITVQEQPKHWANHAHLKDKVFGTASNGKAKTVQGYTPVYKVTKAEKGKPVVISKSTVPAGFHGDVTSVPSGASSPLPKPAPKVLTSADLKAAMKSPQAGKVMKDYDDGTVILTPDGKLGIIKPSLKQEYGGKEYVTATNVETGANFEPPADKPPTKVITDPAYMAAAAEIASKAGTASPTGTAASSHSTASVIPKAGGGGAMHHTKTSILPTWTSVPNGQTAKSKWAQKAGAPQMKPEAFQSLKQYTGPQSGEYNNALRKAEMTPATAMKVMGLDQAFHDLAPLTEDLITHRGAQLTDFKGEVKKGSVIRDDGYMSTSPTKPWGKNVQLHMRVKAGTKIAMWVDDQSSHSGEDEVIIKRGAIMHVVEVADVGGTKHIYVEVLG